MFAQFDSLRWAVRQPLNQGRLLQAIGRWGEHQVRALLTAPRPVDFIANAQLFVGRGLTSANMQYYAGVADPDVVGFLVHVLGPEDLFVDAGANLGVMTVAASAVAGARSLSIEPHPDTFAWLQRNVELNGIGDKVTCVKSALGSASGSVTLTRGLGAENYVVEDELASEVISVSCRRLDDVLEGAEAKVIKIDVEGYETSVLEGAIQAICNPNLKAIVMELAGHGCRYGFDEKKITSNLVALGFEPCTYEPTTRELGSLNGKAKWPSNVIFVRELPTTAAALKRAPKCKIKWDHVW